MNATNISTPPLPRTAWIINRPITDFAAFVRVLNPATGRNLSAVVDTSRDVLNDTTRALRLISAALDGQDAKGHFAFTVLALLPSIDADDVLNALAGLHANIIGTVNAVVVLVLASGDLPRWERAFANNPDLLDFVRAPFNAIDLCRRS